MGKEVKVKPVRFWGRTKEVLRDCPSDVKDDAGFAIHQVQVGAEPPDWKPIKRVGAGAMEIRVWSDDGTYRVILVAKFKDAVHILHVFKKTTEAISQKDIDIAVANYKSIT